MIKLTPTELQIEFAKTREEVMRQECKAKYGKPYPPNSIKKGDGIFHSFVCETCLCDFYGLQFVDYMNRSDYDVFHSTRFGRIDNKTKIRTVAPLPNYLGTVASANTKQRCDFYCFTSILKDCSAMWIAGFMPKEAFYAAAEFHHRGEVDPSSDRGWRFKADCWNMPYGEMWEPPQPDDIGSRFLVTTQEVA